MLQSIRLFLLFEAAPFLFASLIHHGVLFQGYAHREAAIAEGVIGIVLLAGLALTALRPASTRAFGLAAQAFALLGTCVGIVMIAIGVGPQTQLDIALHTGMIILLALGLGLHRPGAADSNALTPRIQNSCGTRPSAQTNSGWLRYTSDLE